MRSVKQRLAFGTLAAVALLLGSSAVMPLGSAEGTASVDGAGELAKELGGLDGVHRERYSRTCNVTAREIVDEDHDGNGEFAFVEVACREAADLDADGVVDAWRSATANWTRVDGDDDGHPELVEIHIATRATADPDEDGVMNAVREAGYSAKLVDEDSDGRLDGAARELRVDASADRNGDGNPEATSSEFKGARASDGDGDGKLDTLAWRHSGRAAFDPNSNGTANSGAAYSYEGTIRDTNGDGAADVATASGERGTWVDRNEDGNEELTESASFDAWKADLNYDGRFDVACVNATHRLIVDRNSDGRPELKFRESASFCARVGAEPEHGAARVAIARAVEVDRDSDGTVDAAREARVVRFTPLGERAGDLGHGADGGAMGGLDEDGTVESGAATRTEGDRLL